MTNEERLSRADRILLRQRDGLISKQQASLEFDQLLMESDGSGRLIYYSDSTGLTADWDQEVMLFPKTGSTPNNVIPSNTGIYAIGHKRGTLVTHPSGAVPDCDTETLEHFRNGSRGWIGGPNA